MVNTLKKWIISFMLGNRQKDLNCWWVPKGLAHHCQLCHQDTLTAWKRYLLRIWISIQCRRFPYTRCILEEVDSRCSTRSKLEECSSEIGPKLDHQQLRCTAGEDGLLQLSRSLESGALDLLRRPANFRSRIKEVNGCVHPVLHDSWLWTGQYTSSN